MQINTAMEMDATQVGGMSVALAQYSDKLRQIVRGIRERLESAEIKVVFVCCSHWHGDMDQQGQTRADRLAMLIMSQMAGEFPILPVRGDWSDGDVDKEAGLYVLQNTVAPAVLVELAFISNPNEEAILARAEGKRMFAAAIARGVTDYIVEVGA